MWIVGWEKKGTENAELKLAFLKLLLWAGMRISNLMPGAQNCNDFFLLKKRNFSKIVSQMSQAAFTILVYCHECVLDAKIIFDLSAFSADSQ